MTTAAMSGEPAKALCLDSYGAVVAHVSTVVDPADLLAILPEQGAPGRAGAKTGVAAAPAHPESAASVPGFPGQGCADAEQRTGNPPGVPDASGVSPILDQLLDYIKGSNGKAERYLDSYQRELSGLPRHDLNQIKAHLKNFDFPAARRAILSLARQNSIHLSVEHTGEYHS